MTPLRASDLRHRVTIRRASEVEKANGGYEDVWSDLAVVWAEVTGLDGRESVMAHVLSGVSVYRVRIRWRGDIRASDQIRSTAACFGGRDVNIRSVVDPDGRREQLVIIADTAATLGA